MCVIFVQISDAFTGNHSLFISPNTEVLDENVACSRRRKITINRYDFCQHFHRAVLNANSLIGYEKARIKTDIKADCIIRVYKKGFI